MKHMHHVIPIPAYNIKGKLIKPDAYHQCLDGALVEVYFNLFHWSIVGKRGTLGNDVYSSDIVLIQVLASPCPSLGTMARTLHKRKFDLFIDPTPSPTKRAHHI